MKQTIKIAVIGGTGKSGKYLVNQLINQGLQFKILVRNPEHFQTNNPNIEVIYGNVTDYHSIYELLKDCQVVISTLGMGVPPSEPTIFSQSTSNVIKAMNSLKIKRYIVTTGLNVDTPFDQKSTKTAFATEWMKNTFPLSTSDKQLEYKILSTSNVDWTLVRLPLIEMTEERNPVTSNLENCQGDKISATDLAHFLIEQLTSETFIRKAPFIYNL